MKIRIGFVAMSMELEHASPSQTMTAASFKKIADREAALRKLTSIAKSNLHNTLRILKHAAASGIYVYRLTSRLVPLLGHELTFDWPFWDQLSEDYKEIGNFAKHHEMRLSFHPDHFTLLNSPKSELLPKSISILHQHVKQFELMGLDSNSKMVLHVGGAYQNKKASIERFAENWQQVPPIIQERIMLENDDKSFTARETVDLCRRIGIPMVFDVHHHFCNSLGENRGSFQQLLRDIAATWSDTPTPVKVHVSSPKSQEDIRAHADYVNPADVIPFLEAWRELNLDLDLMVEAKHKDKAALALANALAEHPNFTRTGPAALTYK